MKYSVRVIKATKTLNEDIINAIEYDSTLNSEIQSTIDTANKRIQRLQQSGVNSPALQALNRQGITKFSNSGTWEQKREQYAQAISFMNSPTSSVTGAREYLKDFANRHDIDEDLANEILESVDDYISSNPELESYINSYGLGDEVASDVSDEYSEIFDNAKELEEYIQNQINAIANETVGLIDEFLDDDF